MLNLLTRTVTIYKADGTSSTTPGSLQQRRRDEADGHGEFSRTEWLLVLSAEASLDTADTVSVDGTRYEVAGDPWPVYNELTGEVHHIEATLTRTGSGSSGTPSGEEDF